jgi:hypothetical protein
MRRRVIVIFVLFLVVAIVPPAQSAPRDFASIRKAADAFAAQSKPGSKLWRIDLTGSYDGASFQIQEGEFHYFLLAKGDVDLFSAKVKSLEGMHLPQIDRGKYGMDFRVEEWQTTPVPGNVRSPDDVLRRLNRPIRGEPGRGLIYLKLVQAGSALANSPRRLGQWNLLADALGVRRADVLFFARTAPHGQWIWWTVVEQDRPPGSVPRLGTRRRVQEYIYQEYIYVDAVTGKATSHRRGPGPNRIPCKEEARSSMKTQPDSLLGVTGTVRSFSAERLVIVTDRDMSLSLRKGTEMAFLLSQPYLQGLSLQSGDLVTIRYEEQSGKMIAHEIILRPSERP